MSKTINKYLLTLNCHPNDTLLFEDYLTLIRTWLDEDSRILKYSWSIEMDDTIHRHLHLYIECTSFKDSSKLCDRLKTKEFKSIQTKLNDSKTIFKTAFKIDKITETPKKALGYTQKWNSSRRAHKGFTDDEIIDAIEYYYTMTRLDKTEAVKDDWKHVTSRNFHAIVEDFVRKDADIASFKDSDLIKIKMTKKFHTFQLPVKEMERYFKELRIAHEDSTKEDENSCGLEAYAFDKGYDKYMEEDIMDLLKYISSLKDSNIEINVPNKIYGISQKYNFPEMEISLTH